MANNCETTIIQIAECDDNYVSTVSYDDNTELLTISLTDGTIYQTTIPQGLAQVSATAGNQIVTLGDGLYVPLPASAVNNVAYENGDNLELQSADGTITIAVNKIGMDVIADLSITDAGLLHDPVSVVPNTAYAFDDINQILYIPLPTLVQTGGNPNEYTYTANDGSGDIYVLTFHPELIVNFDQPSTFNSATQTLNLARPQLVDNLDGTYDYDPGDGSGNTFVIDTTNATVDVCAELASCDLGDLGDANLAGASVGQVIKWSGTEWIPAEDDNDGSNTDVENPWAEEGGTQPLRTDPLDMTQNIYRTGTVGIGTELADTTQGQLEVRGDTYVTTDSDEVSLIFQVNLGGTVDEVINSLEYLTTLYQIQWKNSTRSLMVIDEEGNFAIGDNNTLETLPEDTNGAGNTFTQLNSTELDPPSEPISVYAATDFILTM